MSEATFPFKKAIPIIVVTWILSLATTLAVVYFAPNIFPKTWHEVARFEGTDDEETSSFKIPSINWRIIWAIDDSSPEDASFRFYVSGRRAFTFREITLYIPDWGYTPFETGEEYLTGSGWWSIEVVANGLDSWYIIAEAYY